MTGTRHPVWPYYSVPVNAVCFGNHESDVPYPSLVKRIGEFKAGGVFTSTALPTIQQF